MRLLTQQLRKRRRNSVLEAAVFFFTSSAISLAATTAPTTSAPPQPDADLKEEVHELEQSLPPEPAQPGDSAQNQGQINPRADQAAQGNQVYTPPAQGQQQYTQQYQQQRAATPQQQARPGQSVVNDRMPVNQEQFRQAILVLKRTVERLDRAEGEVARLKAQGPAASSDTIDLSNMGSTPQSSVPAKGGFHGTSVAAPTFKVYFDFDVVSRPGQEPFSFKNYHSYLFFELIPTPTIQFSFDVEPSPKYYELDLQATPKLQVRIGKIWIPFDDLSPHNIFGGRVNTSYLATNTLGNVFLPDIWADLGVGIKYNLIDTRLLSVDLHLYVVNGFGSGGNDPFGSASAPYPNFAVTGQLAGTPDNNSDKAIGGRVHATFLSGLSLGASFYTGRWTNDTGPSAEPSERVNILGLDAQLRINRAELRTGLAYMNCGLVPGTDTTGATSFSRAGAYVEGGLKFGPKQDWKVLARTGDVQLDSRGDLPSDQIIAGGTLLYKPGLIEYSVEFSHDLLDRPGKLSYNYFAGRVIVGL
jgi:hypothetical protein